MKTIDELEISDTPWTMNDHTSVSDAHCMIVSRHDGMYSLSNALLIAAAPELYEAVTYLLANLNLFAPQSLRNKMKKTIQFAEKALAKASGEEVK